MSDHKSPNNTDKSKDKNAPKNTSKPADKTNPSDGVPKTGVRINPK
jgi:hypothetical protein